MVDGLMVDGVMVWWSAAWLGGRRGGISHSHSRPSQQALGIGPGPRFSRHALAIQPALRADAARAGAGHGGPPDAHADATVPPDTETAHGTT